MSDEERAAKCRVRSSAAYYKNPEQYRKRAAERYANFRAFIEGIKTRAGCRDCGNTDHRVLDFDHVGAKSFNIAKGDAVSRATLIEEIGKCEVRCANCHRVKTWERLWKK